MKIGILQTGHAPDTLIDQTGDYDDFFRRLLADKGLDFDTYSVVDGVFPDGADAADGWLITGSRFGAYEGHDWIPPLEDLIRDIHTRGQPMVGICFGHQIIAQALGGKVEKFDGGWAIGATQYDFDGKQVTLNAWHQDQVTERPEGARVVGSNPFCDNAMLAYGDTIWTVQPHPEFTSDFVDGLIRTRGRGVVPDPVLDAAATRLETPIDSADIAAFMAAFLKKERTS
ncbi:type 1 glutamine amidotransferase [Falsiphaeobacter marinintestinus]|uniref:type 1 glutamine amidotransferase n=1 Tax=Falsiphaeobacter marinintestinus TaxID=1492905 RepID=UPI0011B4F639|nr:type 1 glutamine amidotransferase [Phaeobacter marinintestinus]